MFQPQVRLAVRDSVQQVTCCAESRTSKPLVALLFVCIKVLQVLKICFHDETVQQVVCSKFSKILNRFKPFSFFTPFLWNRFHTWWRKSNTLTNHLQKNIEKKKQSWELKNLRALRGNLRQTNIPFFWPISFTFSVSRSKSRERLNDTNQQKKLPNDTFVIYANRICIKKNGGLCETHKHVQYWYALLRLIKLLQSNFDSPKVSEILNC